MDPMANYLILPVNNGLFLDMFTGIQTSEIQTNPSAYRFIWYEIT